MYVDVSEGDFAREMGRHHDHSGNPEEDDVVARDQNTAW